MLLRRLWKWWRGRDRLLRAERRLLARSDTLIFRGQMLLDCRLWDTEQGRQLNAAFARLSRDRARLDRLLR